MSEINLKINLTYGNDYMSANVTRDALLWQFICWGIFLPVVSLIGLVGNSLTIVVLWRKEMQSTTILYMRAMVLTDTGILLTAAIVLTPFACAHYLHNNALRYFSDNIYPILYTPINFTVMTLQACNVWITVSVSVERYIAICHPFKAARICTRRKTFVVLVAITLVSVLYNIPRLFATHARACAEGEKSLGSSCYYLADTDLGRAYWYKTIYFSILYTILIFVVPLSALFILNFFLIQELMRMQRRRSGTNIHDENEANLSLVLVLIVVVFIFCQAPGLISQFDIFEFTVFLKWIAVSNLLFVVNSAVNFLIYTAFGSKFRKVLLRVFRRLSSRSRGLSLRSSIATTNGYELTAVQDNQTVIIDSFDKTSSLADSASFKDHRVADVVKDERTPLTSATYCLSSDALAPSRRDRSPLSRTGVVPSPRSSCASTSSAGDGPRTKVVAFAGDDRSSCSSHASAMAEVACPPGDVKNKEWASSTSTAGRGSLQDKKLPPTILKNSDSKQYSITRDKGGDDVFLATRKTNHNSSNNNTNNNISNSADLVKDEDRAPFRRAGSGPKPDSGCHSLVFPEKGAASSYDDSVLVVINTADSSNTQRKAGLRQGLKLALSFDSVNDGRVAVTKSDSCHSLRNDTRSALFNEASPESVRNGRISLLCKTTAGSDAVESGSGCSNSSSNNNSKRVSLTKAASSDSVTNDRTPKILSGRPENGHVLKTDRYPISHCVVTNGPIPADV